MPRPLSGGAGMTNLQIRQVTIQQPLFSNPGGGAEAPETAPNLAALGVPMLAPTIQQWSLGVQRELPRRFAALGVSYVASRGSHLFGPLAINNPKPGVAAGLHVNAVRPFLGYGSMTQCQSTAASVYHSVQVSFNGQLASAFTCGVAICGLSA